MLVKQIQSFLLGGWVGSGENKEVQESEALVFRVVSL